MDKAWYIKEGLRQLQDTNIYKKTTSAPFEELYHQLNNICTSFRDVISPQEHKFILHTPIRGYKVCPLYFLPKLHKPTITGRPICAYNSFIFENTSKWLHQKLYPLLISQPQHLTDSLSLIKDLTTLKLPPKILLFTFDIESLYPSIPTKQGLEALNNMLLNSYPKRLANCIYRLSALTLEYHFLQFNGQVYQQIQGTAMGSNFSVAYACLFLCYLENLQEPNPRLIYYKRYIDDAFGIWQGDKESLRDYLDRYAIKFKEFIRITSSISQSKVDFLDLSISIGKDFYTTHHLTTNIFQKPLNKYQYIPFSSLHPLHQKRLFIKSELTRYILRESSLQGYLTIRKLFYERLRARGYPPSFLKDCFDLVTYANRNSLLSKRTNTSKNVIVFKLVYSKFTLNLKIKTLLKRLHQSLLKDPLLSHIPKPIICWLNPKNLRSLLVRKNIS